MAIVVPIQIVKQGVRINFAFQIGAGIGKRQLSARYRVISRVKRVPSLLAPKHFVTMATYTGAATL